MDETVEVLLHFLTVSILYIMNMVLCLNSMHDHTRPSELIVVLSLKFLYICILYSAGLSPEKKVEWCFIYKIHKTTRWEVVKNSASPKRPFFFFCAFSSIFGVVF